MAKSRKVPTESQLSAEKAHELVREIEELTGKFRGQFDELESAIGMLMLGRLFGWKVLVLIHNKRTIRKYEDILGINIREKFDEEGPLAHRSLGLKITKSLGNFWKAVSGELKIENRRELADS